MKIAIERVAHLGFLLLGLLLLAVILLNPPQGGITIVDPPDEIRRGTPLVSLGSLDPRPISSPAPTFSLQAKDGSRVSLSALKGRSVLLSFWATWCKSCKDELPHLTSLAHSLQDKPFVVVLVSVDEGWKDVDKLAQRLEGAHGGLTGNQILLETVGMLRGQKKNVVMLLDSAAQTPKAYGTSKYPETYLIDASGSLKYKFIGPKAWGNPESVRFFREQLQ
jgi:peroxiredoxin